MSLLKGRDTGPVVNPHSAGDSKPVGEGGGEKRKSSRKKEKWGWGVRRKEEKEPRGREGTLCHFRDSLYLPLGRTPWTCSAWARPQVLPAPPRALSLPSRATSQRALFPAGKLETCPVPRPVFFLCEQRAYFSSVSHLTSYFDKHLQTGYGLVVAGGR